MIWLHLTRINVFTNIITSSEVEIFKKSFEYYHYIVAGIFSFAFIVQLLYYFILFSRFTFYRKRKKIKRKKEPISVIICARNEAENLKKNLPIILNQDYPNYEVIVVNDCSTDNTDELIGNLLNKYNNLRTTIITEDIKFSHGKKLAITVGVKAAKNEILIFTDADCKPISRKWLYSMYRNFTEETSIVLGYGGYKPTFSLLNNYIRYDTLFIAIQYFSFALARIPYMGVGRNLAYKKSLFFVNKGFANHAHILSGDDDLFVNENATRYNTAIECSAESVTRSIAATKIYDWIKQKRRHFTTAKYYKPLHKFLLGFEISSRFLFYSSLVLLILFDFNLKMLLGIVGFRLLIQLITVKRAMNKLNEKNVLLSTIIFDVFAIFINFIIYFWKRNRANKLKWK